MLPSFRDYPRHNGMKEATQEKILFSHLFCLKRHSTSELVTGSLRCLALVPLRTSVGYNLQILSILRVALPFTVHAQRPCFTYLVTKLSIACIPALRRQKIATN